MVESVSLSSGVAFRVNTHLSSPNTDFCMPLYSPALVDMHPTTCRRSVKSGRRPGNNQDLVFTFLQEGTEKITVVGGQFRSSSVST